MPLLQQGAADGATLLDPGPGIVSGHPIFITRSPEPRTIFQSASLPSAMKRTLWSLTDFDIKAQLYRSATSLVVLATDQRTSINVVLKLYLKAKLVTLTSYQVEREIRIHSRLDHPDIIALFAAFENQKYVVLVLQHAAGGDLHTRLDRLDRSLSEPEICALVQRLAAAVVYLHSENVIHRDIKPENILLSARGASIKLADFGLSIDSSQERPVTRGGTLDYMAPEILLCHNKARPQDYKDKPQLMYDAKVDAWAVGVLTYELLVGRPPFEHECRFHTVERIMYDRLEFPPGVSAPAMAFVSALLSKSAKRRISLADALQHPWLEMHDPRRRRGAPAADAPCSPAPSPAAAAAPCPLEESDLTVVIQPAAPATAPCCPPPPPAANAAAADPRAWGASCHDGLVAAPLPLHPLCASHALPSAPDLRSAAPSSDGVGTTVKSAPQLHLVSAVSEGKAAELPPATVPLSKAGSLPSSMSAARDIPGRTAAAAAAAAAAPVRQLSLQLRGSLSSEDLVRSGAAAAAAAAQGAAAATVTPAAQSQSWTKASHLQCIVETMTLRVAAAAAGAPPRAAAAAPAAVQRAPSVASRVSYLLAAMAPEAKTPRSAAPQRRPGPRSGGGASASASLADARDSAQDRQTWDTACLLLLQPSDRRPGGLPRSMSLNVRDGAAVGAAAPMLALRAPAPAAAARSSLVEGAEAARGRLSPGARQAGAGDAAALPPAPASPHCTARTSSSASSDAGALGSEQRGSLSCCGDAAAAGGPLRVHVKRASGSPSPKALAPPPLAAASGLPPCREARPRTSRLLPRLFCFGGAPPIEC